MHPDFKDLLSGFNAHGVEYLVVGAHAGHAGGPTSGELDKLGRELDQRDRRMGVHIVVGEVAQETCGDDPHIGVRHVGEGIRTRLRRVSGHVIASSHDSGSGTPGSGTALCVQVRHNVSPPVALPPTIRCQRRTCRQTATVAFGPVSGMMSATAPQRGIPRERTGRGNQVGL